MRWVVGKKSVHLGVPIRLAPLTLTCSAHAPQYRGWACCWYSGCEDYLAGYRDKAIKSLLPFLLCIPPKPSPSVSQKIKHNYYMTQQYHSYILKGNEKACPHKDSCTEVFIGRFIGKVKFWEQHEYPSADEQRDKMRYIHTMGKYSQQKGTIYWLCHEWTATTC